MVKFRVELLRSFAKRDSKFYSHICRKKTFFLILNKRNSCIRSMPGCTDTGTSLLFTLIPLIQNVFLLCNMKDSFLSVCSADNTIILTLNWKIYCRACSETGFGMNFKLFLKSTFDVLFCFNIVYRPFFASSFSKYK